MTNSKCENDNDDKGWWSQIFLWIPVNSWKNLVNSYDVLHIEQGCMYCRIWQMMMTNGKCENDNDDSGWRNQIFLWIPVNSCEFPILRARITPCDVRNCDGVRANPRGDLDQKKTGLRQAW